MQTSLAINPCVSAPDRSIVERRYPIEVRSPHLPITYIETVLQGPGENYAHPKDVLAGFAPGTGSVTVSYSPIRGMDPGPLLDSLWRYPYGCSEQLVSIAFPLLFVPALFEEKLRVAMKRVARQEMIRVETRELVAA